MNRRAIKQLKPAMEKAGLDPRHSAGLFVGVRDYLDPAISPVQFAVDDAVDLAYLFSLELGLIEPSKIVLAISGEPLKQVSQERLAGLLAHRAQRSPATLYEIYRLVYQVGMKTEKSGLYVVSFAGHGFNDQGASIFCPQDLLHRRFVHTGLSLDAAGDDIDLANAERRLVFVDACRIRRTTDRAVGDAAPTNEAFLESFSRIRGSATLFAASKGGYSYDDKERQNGVFTSYLIDGLRGGAAQPGCPFITLKAISDFVEQKVRQWITVNRAERQATNRGVHLSQQSMAMLELPLAVNSQSLRATGKLRKRVDAALQKLRLHIAEPLTGQMFDRVSAFLNRTESGELVNEVLDEIESLDGTARTRQRLSRFLKHRAEDLEPVVELRPESKPEPKVEPPPPLRKIAAENHVKPVSEIVRPSVETEKDSRSIAGNLGPLVVPAAAPRWASAFGSDEAGLWAELEVAEGIRQKMRWIERGAFLMGSTEEETGHGGNESPRHEVAIPEGFWLAATPCSQQVWLAVMKWNGSRFRSSERPVESVGWNDTQAFCSRLAGRFRDLDFGLPTEAQWEYACRAGSSGATYAGELEVLGINHAPVLDAIAWYAGNSGHRFELAVGEDASSWPETQYPFTRAGTRTVGQKIANAWGLFDMLGNVWEWCQDEWQEQYGIPPTIADGVLRTIRGGSFRSAPANLRAARRDRKSSSTKSIDLGFRFLCQERDLSKK